jgi:hypothetical protein
VALGQIADRRASLRRRAPEHGDRPGREREQAEERPHQRRLAGAVRPEHRDELAEPNGQLDVAEDLLAAQAAGRVFELDRDCRRRAAQRRGDHRPVA